MYFHLRSRCLERHTTTSAMLVTRSVTAVNLNVAQIAPTHAISSLHTSPLAHNTRTSFATPATLSVIGVATGNPAVTFALSVSVATPGPVFPSVLPRCRGTIPAHLGRIATLQ